MRLKDIVDTLNLGVHATTSDWSEVEIRNVAPLTSAAAGDITFFTNRAFETHLKESRAAALIVREPSAFFHGPQLIHKDPQYIFAKIALHYFCKIDHGPEGVHPKASVHPSAKIGARARIGANVVIEAGAVLGDGVVIYPGVYLGRDVEVGQDTVIHANCTVYFGSIIGERCLIHAGSVIGADGFGFAVSQGEICKIPQLGIVRIGHDVELGALCTIDRAAFGETKIGNFCKFDDRVHIGHNCDIGDNSMFSAQVGIGGSTKIGKWVLMGGQSGVADHMVVVDGTRIGAKTGVVQSIEKRDTYVGFPAVPQKEWMRQVVYTRRLKDFEQRIKQLEEQRKE